MMQRLLDDWCRTHLGSPVRTQFFGVERISSVHGLRLADGREVAVKVRTAQSRQAACALVQRWLWEAGLPCPQPLAGPLPLAPPGADPLVDLEGSVLDPATLAVSAETWEGAGSAGLGPMEPADWGRLAARIVAASPNPGAVPTLAPPVPWLHWDHDDPARTWAPAASHRWDPHRIEGQLDPVVPEVARRARARLLRPDAATLPRVVGHGDLEAQNCRWVPGRAAGDPLRLVVHDWDSVVAVPEAVLAGCTAITFPSVADDAIADVAQTEQCLAGYAEARGRPWSALEQEVAWATGAWVAAYNAAFEGLKEGPGPVTSALCEQAVQRLARAGAEPLRA